MKANDIRIVMGKVRRREGVGSNYYDLKYGDKSDTSTNTAVGEAERIWRRRERHLFIEGANSIVHEEDGRLVAMGRAEEWAQWVGDDKDDHGTALQLREYRPWSLSLQRGGGIELGTVTVYELATCSIVMCSLVNAADGDGEEERRSPTSGEGFALGSGAARVAGRNTQSSG
ncbi:hypothetical protein JB92DRAFT_2834945 [Gautieria morchelliformis]|nr:hypothetical protein JB92DRAFT_2834945 [Gautieria morchelliformis]